jgi:hypothetical protein
MRWFRCNEIISEVVAGVVSARIDRRWLATAKSTSAWRNRVSEIN